MRYYSTWVERYEDESVGDDDDDESETHISSTKPCKSSASASNPYGNKCADNSFTNLLLKNTNLNDTKLDKISHDIDDNDDDDEDEDDDEFSSSFSLAKSSSSSSAATSDDERSDSDNKSAPILNLNPSKIFDKTIKKQKNIDDSDSVVFEYDQNDSKPYEDNDSGDNPDDLVNGECVHAPTEATIELRRTTKSLVLQKTSTIDENNFAKPFADTTLDSSTKKIPIRKYRQFIYIQVRLIPFKSKSLFKKIK